MLKDAGVAALGLDPQRLAGRVLASSTTALGRSTSTLTRAFPSERQPSSTSRVFAGRHELRVDDHPRGRLVLVVGSR